MADLGCHLSAVEVQTVMRMINLSSVELCSTLTSERNSLRETVAKLNRRCQVVESALQKKPGYDLGWRCGYDAGKPNLYEESIAVKKLHIALQTQGGKLARARGKIAVLQEILRGYLNENR